MVRTYSALYLSARRALLGEGVEAASLEARELLCRAAGKSREALLRDMALYATSEIAARMQALLARRLAGEPLAYLLGEWEFYGRSFAVNAHVLIPRPDTECLAEWSIHHLQRLGPGAALLDLCAGSGCVGITAALEVPGCSALLVEASAEALTLCRENIQRHELEERACALWGDVLQEPEVELAAYELLCCNPPYIPTGELAALDASVREFEPQMALDGGADGLDFYRAIAKNWLGTLRPGGRVLLEVGATQAAAVRALLEGAGCLELTIHRDLAGRQRVVEGRVAGPAEARG